MSAQGFRDRTQEVERFLALPRDLVTFIGVKALNAFLSAQVMRRKMYCWH